MSDRIVQAFEGEIEAAEHELDDCPIVPLGYWENGRVYVLDALGMVRSLDGDRLYRNVIANLCCGNTEWFAAAFPVTAKPGSKRGTIDDGFDATAAANWIRRVCATRGVYPPETPVLGLGGWRTPNGGLIYNFGDVSWRPGSGSYFDRVGTVIDKVVVKRAPEVERPNFGDSASSDEACELRDRLAKTWRFRREFDADLFMGWIVHCYLGAYLPWRCHIIVTGQTGSGKSWLSQFTEKLLAGAARPVQNQVSAASIISQASNDSRAVILDEAERDDDSSARIRKIIELMRLTNTGTGANISRGTADGGYRFARVTSAFGLFCILAPKLLPADRTRITRIDLAVLYDQDDRELTQALRDDPGKITREGRLAKNLIADAGELGPRLHARVLQEAGRFDGLFEIYHQAFASAKIGTHDVDQFATFLAARDLLYDDMPTNEQVSYEVERLLPLIEGAKQNRDDGEGTQCWQHLLTTFADLWRTGVRKTIAQLIQDALYGGTTGDDETRSALKQIGIRVECATADAPARVLVCRNHAALDRQFAGQPRWTENGYSDALMYLPDAHYTQAVRFAGIKQRAISIPAAYWPDPPDEATAGRPEDEVK